MLLLFLLVLNVWNSRCCICTRWWFFTIIHLRISHTCTTTSGEEHEHVVNIPSLPCGTPIDTPERIPATCCCCWWCDFMLEVLADDNHSAAVCGGPVASLAITWPGTPGCECSCCWYGACVGALDKTVVALPWAVRLVLMLQLFFVFVLLGISQLVVRSSVE